LFALAARCRPHIANYESPGRTKLHDRRQDEISLDEAEKITIQIPIF
jgi:hypothetical protein